MDKNISESTQEFTPPRHWVGPEQLEAKYWQDSAGQEKRGQEFYEKPIEWLEKAEKAPNFETSRREFLTIMGASVAMASVACARRPVHKIIPYVNRPEEIVPGVATWYASGASVGQEEIGLLVKNREGRPIKLEGNPDHPFNRGTLNARAQATLLELYDPARIKSALSRKRGSESTTELSLDQADQAVLAKLKSAKKVRLLTGAQRSPSTKKMIAEFLSRTADGQAFEFEALGVDDVVAGQRESYGTAVMPTYRFDEAAVIVSLGADFLGTWGSPIRNAAQWAKNRKVSSANAASASMSKFFCFESSFTITGANADERYPVRAGDEIKVALAIVNELNTKHGMNLSVPAASEYGAAKVAADLGIENLEQGIRDAAKALVAARGKGIVVAGGPTTRSEFGMALQVVVNYLNSSLGNEGAMIDGSSQTVAASYEALGRLTQELLSGSVDVLIIEGTNPVFQVPGFVDAIQKAGTVVVLTERDNETALWADTVLGLSHSLETWNDYQSASGVTTIAQPAISPLHATRSLGEVLHHWSRNLAEKAVAGKDWHEFIQENWKQSIASGGSFNTFWEDALRKGVVVTGAAQSRGSARAFRASALSAVPAFRAKDSTLKLSLYESIAMGDGRHANNAWLQELPDPITSVCWDNYAAISTDLAKKMGIKDDDVIEIALASDGGAKIEVPVVVQPGIHPETVSVALGYGRKIEGKVGRGTGADAFSLVRNSGSAVIFSGATINVRKTGRFYHLARTQWHTATENRPIINDVTLAEFKKNPAVTNHTNPELKLPHEQTMYPKHEYKTYRWGMAIDLNSCIGCNACMIACQAENNIPVVGRDNVRGSRAMHWIRIERYYAGPAENPDVVFQPMLCQHCENAPCENVCPVLATTHDAEGLNVQTYNRCVGTRYCQNNCPYKVRKFNYFDHWKSYDSTMNLAWNPDVTVRTRGIMEKCTFCVQRIREARDAAKIAGTRLTDASFQTACQQTCPTDAITFGDVNNAESKVSRLRKDQRGFKVLDVLNTVPMITYLTKVRNKAVSYRPNLEEKEGHGGGHETTSEHHS